MSKGFLEKRITTLANGRQRLTIADSVVFIICTRDNKLVLSQQLRAGIIGTEKTLGTFGGYLEEGENYYDALLRELKEETSLDADDILYSIPVFHDRAVAEGVSTEKSSGYIIYTKYTFDELKNAGKFVCTDEDEDITIFAEELSVENVSKYTPQVLPSLRGELLVKEALVILCNANKS